MLDRLVVALEVMAFFDAYILVAISSSYCLCKTYILDFVGKGTTIMCVYNMWYDTVSYFCGCITFMSLARATAQEQLKALVYDYKQWLRRSIFG